MNSEYTLRTLLREFETPQMVANHLGVAVQAVYSQMRLFRIQLNYAQLQLAIREIRNESPRVSIGAAADTIGVSRQAARAAMRTPLLQGPANASEEEKRIRAALVAAEYKPRIAARTLGMELCVYYERMNEFSIHVPTRYSNVAERRRIAQNIRQERPGMGIPDIAMLTKIAQTTLRDSLRDPPSIR